MKWLMLVLAIGCAHESAKPKMALTEMVETSREGFFHFDLQYQEELIRFHQSRGDDLQSALWGYRQRKGRVMMLFSVAYAAIAEAELSNKPEAIARAVQSLQDLQSLIQAIRTGEGR